jgi:hypothetical protein
VIKGIVIGFILAIAISVGCVFLYFSAGLAPVATADPPMPRRTQFSCRCDRIQAALPLVSQTSGAAAHGLCDNDVSKTAPIISWQGSDR